MLVKQLVKTINANSMSLASLVALFAAFFASFFGFIPNRRFGKTVEAAAAVAA